MEDVDVLEGTAGGADPPAATGRPMRADAVKNRQRILEAAEEVFAVRGVAAPIDAVAERAGVGVGTLYRHFPNKEALFEAIVLTRLEELARTATAPPGPGDAGEAFFSYLREFAGKVSNKHDLIDALGCRRHRHQVALRGDGRRVGVRRRTDARACPGSRCGSAAVSPPRRSWVWWWGCATQEIGPSSTRRRSCAWWTSSVTGSGPGEWQPDGTDPPGRGAHDRADRTGRSRPPAGEKRCVLPLQCQSFLFILTTAESPLTK